MSRRHHRQRRLRVGVLLSALCLALAGCVGLPDEGPVVSRDADRTTGDRQAIDIDARPPATGASRLQVVSGFLDAMTAWPIQTAVAKEYLSDDAAGEWNPEAATVIYSDSLPPEERGEAVHVELTDADSLDAVGGWRGELPERAQTLRFTMTIEDGEYRIVDPPDALIVPATWFQQRFTQVALYYFDRTAQILVPEPVFLPAGSQRATSLVSALLEGPPDRLRPVVRSFLPAGVSVGLSVPVTDDGVAEVNLVGEATMPSEGEAVLLIAQLAWTLRQDPSITAFRVSMGGQELRLPDGESSFPVDTGNAFDPNGADTTGELHALRRGRLLRGDAEELAPVPGPFGSARYQLESVGVSPDGTRAAGITGDGSTALLAPIEELDEGPEVDTVLDGAGDLARPTWDHAGRLWLLDRRPQGAVVWTRRDGALRPVRVPGITGTDARALLVSRDGTRLLAAVRRASGDRVVGARVVTDSRGRVLGVRAPFTVDAGGFGQRVTDLAWASRTRLAILRPARPGSLFEIDIVSIDGAAVGVDALSTIVSGRVLGIAGPGVESLPTYAVLRDTLVDARTRESVELPTAVDDLGYVG